MADALENIGFYTLSDARAGVADGTTPLWRCELILTDLCNFKCPYCRGIKDDYAGTMALSEAKRILDLWISQGLKNIRFSGGEPLLYKALPELVAHCQKNGVERIAISSNGSLPTSFYQNLLDKGVNDFSISLDACCASTGDEMAGGIKGAWEKVVENIKFLSRLTYVTVGVVITDQNVSQLRETIEFAHSLGVADIRVIPAAQYGPQLMEAAASISQEILDKHPILNYRIQNLRANRNVRGLQPSNNNRCPLVMDDMAVVNGYHFPCIIYLREQGQPIGKMEPGFREARVKWAAEHDTHKDPICSRNCLDVCVDYNDRHRELRKS
jgi:molybdenum cofactor biosynthesis enzyme MoaA